MLQPRLPLSHVQLAARRQWPQSALRGDASRCRFLAAAVDSQPSEPREVSRPSILWSPGSSADETQTDRLAGKIGLLCRDSEGNCVIGSRGELTTARAIRALAKASELGKSAIVFRARWHADSEEERALRFYATMPYTFSVFKQNWKLLVGKARVLQVTPHTGVHNLATAIAMEERKNGGVALKLNHKNDTVLAVAAKALATLPHLALNEERGQGLGCVLRWPRLGDHDAAKFVYAHVFGNASNDQPREEARTEVENASGLQDWANRIG